MSQLASDASLIVLEPRTRLRVRPSIAVQGMLLLLAIGNLGRIPLLSTGDRQIPLLVIDVVAMAVVAIGAVAAIHHRSLRLDVVALLGIAFTAVGALSAMASQARFGLSFGELAVALAFLARWMVYFALYITAINVLRRADARPIWRSLETCVLAFAGFGILQAIFLPGFAQLVYPDSTLNDWDAQSHRLVSTLLDPNYAGALIMIALLIELAMMASGERVAAWKPLTLFIAMLLTLSRGTLLAFAVGFVVVLVARGVSRRLATLLAVGGLAIVASLPKLIAFAASFDKLRLDDPSARARLISWTRGWIVLQDHPIFGIGFNAWGAVQARYGWETVSAARYGIDGGVLFVAVLTGAVGVGLYLGMFGYAFARARSTWRNASFNPFERGLAAGLAASLVAVMVHSLFVNSLLLPFIMEPLWILCALGFVIARET